MNDLRNSILKEIQLLADLNSQIKYENDVPIAHVPSELVCGWFDDLYHPGTELFNNAFSKQEKAILAEFNKQYEELLKKVNPKAMSGTVADLHKDKQWQIIVSSAQEAMIKLNNCI